MQLSAELDKTVPVTDSNLDDLFGSMQKMSSQLSALGRVVTMSAKLGTAKVVEMLGRMLAIVILNRPDEITASLKAFQDSKDFEAVSEIISPLEGDLKILGNVEIASSAEKISTKFNSFNTFKQSLPAIFKFTSGLKNIQGIELFKPAISAIRDFRVYSKSELSDVIKRLPDVQKKLKSLKVVIAGMKGTQSVESDAFSTLSEIGKLSSVIGTASRSVSNMQMAIVEHKRLNPHSLRIIDNLVNTVIFSSKLDVEDQKRIADLSRTTAEVETMISSLDTFKGKVKPITSVTLAGYSNFFDQAQSVEGISADLLSTIASVTKLDRLLPTAKFSSLLIYLKDLDEMGLEFSRFSKDVAAAGKGTLKELDAFFVAYGKKLAEGGKAGNSGGKSGAKNGPGKAGAKNEPGKAGAGGGAKKEEEGGAPIG